MTAAYDAYAKPYQRSKQMPFRVFGETPDHMRVLGDLRGKSVIDLACGDGFYTRLIKRNGSGRTVGVDISGEMIALAQSIEETERDGIEYLCAAVESMGASDPFDVVSAAFLLNNASTKETLETMCRVIATNLVSGGRFVSTNSQFGEHVGIDYSPYGMKSHVTAKPVDATPYTIDFTVGADRFTLTNYHYSRSTYERMLKSAGFESIRWHHSTIIPEGLERFGEDFWRTYLDHPPMVVIEAVKR
jgi:ubiquinone/menaquinone biosynthesis C-methylase UbiE